jgi:hypothetical protein
MRSSPSTLIYIWQHLESTFFTRLLPFLFRRLLFAAHACGLLLFWAWSPDAVRWRPLLRIASASALALALALAPASPHVRDSIGEKRLVSAAVAGNSLVWTLRAEISGASHTIACAATVSLADGGSLTGVRPLFCHSTCAETCLVGFGVPLVSSSALHAASVMPHSRRFLFHSRDSHSCGCAFDADTHCGAAIGPPCSDRGDSVFAAWPVFSTHAMPPMLVLASGAVFSLRALSWQPAFWLGSAAGLATDAIRSAFSVRDHLCIVRSRYARIFNSVSVDFLS